MERLLWPSTVLGSCDRAEIQTFLLSLSPTVWACVLGTSGRQASVERLHK